MTITRNVIILVVIILIIIFIVMIFRKKKVETPNVEKIFVEKKIVQEQEQPQIKSNKVEWSKKNSRAMILGTMPDHVKPFFNEIMDAFDDYHMYIGVKNYSNEAASQDKQFQWEIYFLAEFGNRKLDLLSWYERYKQLFKDNFDIESALVENVRTDENSYEYIRSVSIDIDNETPKHRTFDKLNFYYRKPLDFPADYMEEVTLYAPDRLVLRGKSFVGVQRFLPREKIINMHLNPLGFQEMDGINVMNYMDNLKFPHSFYSLAIKEKEYGLYLTPINYETFLEFVQKYGYSDRIVSYVKNNEDNIRGQFYVEFARYFKKNDSKMNVTRSAFYLTIGSADS